MQNALTIDLEEWYHPLLVQRRLRETPTVSRVQQATRPLLDLLERAGVRATFFCVGDVLRLHPDLLRRIHARGHEIAFHGMHHLPLWDLGPAEFEAELIEFDRIVRELLGGDARVRGFRAPTFSLDRRTCWALPILARHGYDYDSSVFPMRGPLYGVPGSPLGPYPVAHGDPGRIDEESSLVEFPPAVCRLAGVRLPVGGGIYLRMLPLPPVVALLRRINRQRPFVLYVHPWETDPQTPRLPLPVVARLATYANIGGMLHKIERLLKSFHFTTLAEVADRWRRPAGDSGVSRC